MTTLSILALHELREQARSRSLLACAAGFAALSAALTIANGAGGSAGFGPAAAGLINIELIAVPLFALVLGAVSLARDRERGTYAYVRSLPVTLRHIYCSKWIALAAAVTAVVFAGFSGAFAAMAILGMGGDLAGIIQFALLTWVLGLACAAIGLLLSVCSQRTPAALGAAVAAWLLLVIFCDLGIMATSVATRLNLGTLLFVTAANPIEAYKIASVAALSGSVDVLGPGGRLATDILGAALMPVLSAILVAWGAGCIAGGWYLLRRSRDA